MCIYMYIYTHMYIHVHIFNACGRLDKTLQDVEKQITFHGTRLGSLSSSGCLDVRRSKPCC